MRQFILNPEILSTSPVKIEGAQAKHLIKVLRLRKGDQVLLGDGRGKTFQGRIQSLDRQGNLRVEILGPVPATSPSPLHLMLGQAVLKGPKMDLVIQKAVELGAARILPFFSRYSVPKWGPPGIQARLGRWERLIVEAGKQCGQSVLPAVEAPVPLETLLDFSLPFDLKLICYEKEDQEDLYQLARRITPPRKMMILVGPEGGFHPEEIARAENRGFMAVSLGPRILRAETAALVILGIAQFLWGDFKKGESL
jgi:16S rRNA (uracil1498-N3)-methyltransferase